MLQSLMGDNVLAQSKSSSPPPPQAMNNDQSLGRINDRWTIFNDFLLQKLKLYAFTSNSKDY